MHLDPFLDHKMVFLSSYHVFRPLGLVFSAGTTWTLGRSFCSVFCPGGPPGPILFDFYMFSLICCRFGFFLFVILFSLFSLQMLKRQPAGRLVVNPARSFGSLLLMLELIIQLSVIAKCFVSLRLAACIAIGSSLFSLYSDHSFLISS